MARRRIGQEKLWGERKARSGGISLDEVAVLVDWVELDQLLAGISSSAKGELGWPPLALFRALLLASWHDLSDVRLAEALDDRASFRRFCGFSTHEPTPERTSFVRFRGELVRRACAAGARPGSVRGRHAPTGPAWRRSADGHPRGRDAHPIGEPQGRRGALGGAVKGSGSIAAGMTAEGGHRRRKPMHGYKAHVATDQDAGLIHGIEVTTANVHDAAELAAILPDAPGDTYGDSAYQGDRSGEIIRARGGRPCVVHTGGFGGEVATKRLRAHNAAVRRIRCRIEKVFGTCKRSYGLRRMRWLGLAKAGLQVRLAAIAYNLRRSLTLLVPTAA